jgi:MFS transporter, MCT family, solute carrier family 16 (monocarboxylic acid transporters), member 14
MMLQPIKWHWKEEEIDVEMIEGPIMGTLAEEDGDEDALPEIKTLLFQNKRERKISDTLMVPNGTFPKRPTFPRIASSVSVQISPGLTNNGGMPRRPTFPRITSTASMNMNSVVRKRKVSVISQLSQYDFSGSGLHIHMDVGINIRSVFDEDTKKVNFYFSDW